MKNIFTFSMFIQKPRVVNNPPGEKPQGILPQEEVHGDDESSPLAAVAAAQRLAAARVAESALKATVTDCVLQLFCTVGVASRGGLDSERYDFYSKNYLKYVQCGRKLRKGEFGKQNI